MTLKMSVFNGVIKSSENKEAYSFKVNEENGKLAIEVVKPAQWQSHWGEIVLSVPEGMSFEVTSQSGKVELTSIKEVNMNMVSKSGHVVVKDVSGSISSNSPAGDIKVNNLKGDLKAKTKTGAVVINQINGSADIVCEKGNAVVNNVNGNLKMLGGYGNMEVENVDGDVTIKSTSGDIKLSIAKGNIVCRSFDGDIKLFSSEGVYQVQSSTGNITGTRVKYTASSSFTSTEGNVKVQSDTKKDLAFILKSSNSYLRAMGKSKKKSLKIGKGSIVITGTSTTGSQAYY